MSSEAMRIPNKGRFQGGIQVKNEKNKSSLKTDNRPEKSKYKPLWGKIFYLDLPSITISEKLQKDIKDLGGRVEEFLSKDISYLISNKKEAKFAQTLCRISPVPSPESAYTAEATSPHPSHDGSSFKSPETVCLSRGRLLVEKAIKDHDLIPANSILSNALSWGVKILHIDDIKYYIEQKKKELYVLKKSNTSVRDVGKKLGVGTQKVRRRIKKPFVKVEDMSQFYRPFYLQLANMPFINYSTQKPCSPFDVDKPSSIQKQTQTKLRIHTDGDKCGGGPIHIQLKEKKKKGYCECCLQKYEDLDTHLLSEQHRNFAQSNQYQIVDDIISKLVFDFIEYERDTPKKKRIKYSIGPLSSLSGKSVLKKNESKEVLDLHPISQAGIRENSGQVIRQNILYEETKEPEQTHVFLSEPTYPSTGLRGLDEKTISEGSMLNAAEHNIKQNFTQLPPHTNKQECSLDISEHKLVINENGLEELKVDDCQSMLQTYVKVSYFNIDNNTTQPKFKLNPVQFSAKDVMEQDLHSIFGHDSDVMTIKTSKEHLTTEANTASCSSQDPNECDKNMDKLPSGEIHRKVKVLLGQNKTNVEPNVELDKKITEFLTVQEDSTCSSPIQSLLDLFQTSGDKSEFLGFTSYTENSGVCDVLDIWEEESSNDLLSTFFSSPSTSTFVGF
uniref:protein DBF4 homolog A isoform X2 n=1 Tax=Jaculus jaculus TaxID=51337 RepID=UPI001E1B1C5C|nr:protein DBF4 homolog A isoform X2 [Jaculus jaculus]